MAHWTKIRRSHYDKTRPRPKLTPDQQREINRQHDEAQRQSAAKGLELWDDASWSEIYANTLGFYRSRKSA